MSHISSVRAILIIGLLAGAQQASAQNIVHSRTGSVPNPVVLDNTGLFQDKYTRVGDDMRWDTSAGTSFSIPYDAAFSRLARSKFSESRRKLVYCYKLEFEAIKALRRNLRDAHS